MAKINIIGAGLAGLLAANMLRRHHVNCYEKQKELPNNHHAVLRFRTPDVGNVLGIQFNKVQMIKTYVPYANVVADSLSYSKKVTGMYRSDRSIIEGTVTGERYIAPQDLIHTMSNNIDIKFGKNFTFLKDTTPAISTIPMPALMTFLGYECNEVFKKMPGVIAVGTVENCDAYVSVLFPGPMRASRATITGNQLMIEFHGEDNPLIDEITEIFTHPGLDNSNVFDMKFKKQDYFKIMPISEAARHIFMKWATVNYGIYSLGRYACWRPKLLLDDLVHDVRTIENWILGGKK